MQTSQDSSVGRLHAVSRGLPEERNVQSLFPKLSRTVSMGASMLAVLSHGRRSLFKAPLRMLRPSRALFTRDLELGGAMKGKGKRRPKPGGQGLRRRHLSFISTVKCFNWR